jgi:Lactate dehydrogenase and related dehydrogenases
MSSSKPVVVVTRKLPEIVEQRMTELFDVRLNHDDRPMSPAEIADAVVDADVLVPTLTDHIDARVIARCAERCRLIANYGAGVDHIDVATARNNGITVTNTPGVLTEDTADLTLALILAVHRRLAEGIQMMEEDRFVGWSPTHMLGHRVHGKRLGIIGMGRVGAAVARRAKAFGLEINYHNRRRVAKP